MPVLSNVPGRGASQPSPLPLDHDEADATPNPTDPPPVETLRRSRRRWILVAIVAAFAVAAGVIVLLTSGGSNTTETEPITLQAVTAETTDLVEFTDLDGTMRFADTTTLTASGEGVITEVVADGATVVQGDVLYELNGSPVTALSGDTPMYRELAQGVEGDDVLMLEENLAALGLHYDDVDDDGNPIDEEFVVDGIFETATTEAVVRWQEDLGVPATGVVAPASVAVLAGPAEVIDVVVDVGDQVAPGAPVLELNQLASVDAGPSIAAGGEVELFVTDGQPLVSGDVVAAVDGAPVTAIVTDVEFDRDLEDGVDDGADVAVVEEMLLALGYDADGDLVVDETFDDATATALTEWKEDLENTFDGVTVDGSLDLDEILVVAPDTTVGTVPAYETTVLASGSPLWSTTTQTTQRVVTAAIPVADQDQLVEATAVDVEFPDGELVSGTVTSLATSSTVDPANPDADATLAVEITLPSVPVAFEALNELDVVVKLVDEIAVGVTAVPVSALVAVGDGTYAVEVVSGGATQFVGVAPGMFSNGLVEVDGITPGTQVVVPS